MTRPQVLLLAYAALAACTGSGCVTMAAPPPLATFGGPATAPRGQAEVAIAAGAGGSLFPGAHAGGNGWFTRWRRASMIAGIWAWMSWGLSTATWGHSRPR